MEKNNLLDLIKQISAAAANVPKAQTKSEEPQNTGSFKNSIIKKNVETPKTQSTKKAMPSTDAILQMIRRHNELSQSISLKNSTNKQPNSQEQKPKTTKRKTQNTQQNKPLN